MQQLADYKKINPYKGSYEATVKGLENSRGVRNGEVKWGKG